MGLGVGAVLRLEGLREPAACLRTSEERPEGLLFPVTREGAEL